jgi:class 3 adenylate cyclase
MRHQSLHLLHIHNALTRNSLKTSGREVSTPATEFGPPLSRYRMRLNVPFIQKAFAAYNKENPEEPLYLRIGLSAGEPIEEHGDLFGKAVQLAARLCAHAEPARILVDQVVLNQWQGEAPLFSDLGEVTLKGFEHAVRVYEVNWTEA